MPKTHTFRWRRRQWGEGTLRRERSLSVQAAALALGSGIAQVLVAALYILTARRMETTDFGVVVTAMAIGLAGAGFADLGASSYWIREIASERVSVDELSAKMSTRLFIALLMSVAVVAVALSTDPRFVAAGALLMSTTTVLTVLVPLRAAKRAVLIGWLTVLSRTVAIAAFFVQSAVGVGPGIALWTSLVGGDLCLITFVVATERRHLRLTRLRLSNPWSGARWYSLSSLSGSAQNLDLPLVAAGAGATAAGIYGGVNRWIQPMVLTISAFASASAPILATGASIETLRRQILRASWVLFMAIMLSVAVLFLAPKIVDILLGESYASSALVLQWLAAGMALNALAQPLLVALQSRQYDNVAAVIFLSAVVVQLMIIAVLAPSIGALSAGIAFFTSQVLQLVGGGACVALILRRRARCAS